VADNQPGRFPCCHRRCRSYLGSLENLFFNIQRLPSEKHATVHHPRVSAPATADFPTYYSYRYPIGADFHKPRAMQAARAFIRDAPARGASILFSYIIPRAYFPRRCVHAKCKCHAKERERDGELAAPRRADDTSDCASPGARLPPSRRHFYRKPPWIETGSRTRYRPSSIKRVCLKGQLPHNAIPIPISRSLNSRTHVHVLPSPFRAPPLPPAPFFPATLRETPYRSLVGA